MDHMVEVGADRLEHHPGAADDLPRLRGDVVACQLPSRRIDTGDRADRDELADFGNVTVRADGGRSIRRGAGLDVRHCALMAAVSSAIQERRTRARRCRWEPVQPAMAANRGRIRGYLRGIDARLASNLEILGADGTVAQRPRLRPAAGLNPACADVVGAAHFRP